jgi:hypothetical protein
MLHEPFDAPIAVQVHDMVQVVLAKRQHGHQGGTCHDCFTNKPLASFQDEGDLSFILVEWNGKKRGIKSDISTLVLRAVCCLVARLLFFLLLFGSLIVFFEDQPA